MELLVLGLVATIGFASYALWSKSRAPDEESATPPLLAPHERTLATLEVGDVVQHLGTDYVVEGALRFADGDARGARLYRIADASVERYLYATAGEADPLLLDARPALVLDGAGAPESVLHEGQTYQLKGRVSAQVTRAGIVLGEAGDRADLFEYAAGAARLLVVHWGARADALVGERVSAHLLELLPGQ